MNWTCEQIEARLSDYLDDLLDHEERRGFTAHAASCARCKRLVAQVGGLVVQWQRLEPVQEPPRLIYKILDQTIGPRKAATGWRAALEWLRPMAQPRFAMGVATTVLAVLMFSQAMGVEWTKIQGKDLLPANLYRSANSRAHLLYARGVKFVNDLRVVYEIQTRLQTPQEPEPAPPRQAPGSTEKAPGKSDRDINRANELRSVPIMLASMLTGVPGRNLR